MKMSKLFAAIVLAGSIISGSASALSFTTITTPNLYDVHGSLAARTKITFTYNNNAGSPGPFLLASGDENVGVKDTSSFSLDPVTGHPSTSSSFLSIVGGALSVNTLANIGGVSSITISNLSNSVSNFRAFFSAINLAAAGTFSSFGPVPTPLPASAVMFLTALAGLGFVALRKNKQA